MLDPTARANEVLAQAIKVTGATMHPINPHYVQLTARNGEIFFVSAMWIIKANPAETTCYYIWPPLQGAYIPWQEKVATALLSLWNSPENFKHWCNRTDVRI